MYLFILSTILILTLLFLIIFNFIDFNEIILYFVKLFSYIQIKYYYYFPKKKINFKINKIKSLKTNSIIKNYYVDEPLLIDYYYLNNIYKFKLFYK